MASISKLNSLKTRKVKVQNKPVLWLGGTDCPPQKEEEFNAWYNKVHIPMVLKAPGMVRAKRYEVIEAGNEYPRFLAIYELENEAAFELAMKSQEMATARQEMIERWGGGSPLDGG